ncbi:response regulator [Spirulina sp. CS-785/01]|uniref:response regulator n=1 Tax=Spirulina sp. CS-785/01 TaxID=3021716 RepID=UPI00232BBBA3|nr:response regulator [Spirulina sp. CS-785/01]MDB9313656.1 response regulator [Spirulina sp. CS-785/01]
MRVLLVEDQEDIGQAVKRTLTHNGYLVDWTLDGETAWSYLISPELEYRVGIIDWMLPGLSGLELIRELPAQNLGLKPRPFRTAFLGF